MSPQNPTLLSTASLFAEDVVQYHMSLLTSNGAPRQAEEASQAPIVASSVLKRLQDCPDTQKYMAPLQFGLLAGSTEKVQSQSAEAYDDDPRLLFNVTAPSSTHTLSCMLETCLLPSGLGRLANPLTGVVFHYDTFISDTGGSPCEAAFLSSHSSVSVRVLCSPTNMATIKRTYKRLDVVVEPLQIDQRHVNTKRMVDLMAVSQGDVPLYMESVKRLLREMRIVQQHMGDPFDYHDFKKRVAELDLTPGQLAPLTQRLETLESFMPSVQTTNYMTKNQSSLVRGTYWTPVPSRSTVVDLSCPCIPPETTCSLFNICLGIFLQEEDFSIGRYMTSSTEATVFTDTILSAVRLQRHLGVRVIISTQEPTISTALLDLCSVTIVHRFTSPEWLNALGRHLAAAAKDTIVPGGKTISSTRDRASLKRDLMTTLFDRIVRLRVGDALLFASSAIIGVGHGSSRDEIVLLRLGGDSLAVTVRGRLTYDGGKSILSL
ncbi:hypothetical protein BJX70DRAFT_409466 [Aspergillus crustosus]